MEYAAEGSIAPLVCLRYGKWKYVRCTLDPDQLFDLDADPQELTNLAGDPAHAGHPATALRAKSEARWDLAAFDAEVRASQARRWVVYEALRQGGYYPWDYQPLQKASERYMRNHMDLNVLEDQQTLSAGRMRSMLLSLRKHASWPFLPGGTPMLTIYGRATSSNVQLVMWAVGELGLAHERLDYGHVHGGIDTPEFRAMNPRGLVPVLRDGDLVVWESCAILRYLAARYGDGGAFWPADPRVARDASTCGPSGARTSLARPSPFRSSGPVCARRPRTATRRR